jgi:hypothetical protein
VSKVAALISSIDRVEEIYASCERLIVGIKYFGASASFLQTDEAVGSSQFENEIFDGARARPLRVI